MRTAKTIHYITYSWIYLQTDVLEIQPKLFYAMTYYDYDNSDLFYSFVMHRYLFIGCVGFIEIFDEYKMISVLDR